MRYNDVTEPVTVSLRPRPLPLYKPTPPVVPFEAHYAAKPGGRVIT